MTTFAMFTDAGNAAVGEIVRSSKEKGLCWLETYQELCRLAEVSCFAEATDTAVREAVYCALDFDKEKTL